MSAWLVLLLGGLATFAERYAFVYLFGRTQLPPAVHRALRFVPPAVLGALVVPELVAPGGRVSLAADNFRLFAGLLAALVAWRTKHALLTIVVGMLALVLLEWLL